MRALPTVLIEVISVTPAMAPSARSSGVVRLVATVSGDAPGRLAETWMVGKSTLGSGDTGSFRKATRPASAMPMVSSVVATGRAMKGADRFTSAASRRPIGSVPARTSGLAGVSSGAPRRRRPRRSKAR